MTRARHWLSRRLGTVTRVEDKRGRPDKVIAFALILLVALGVRWLHWQDAQAEMARGDSLRETLIRPYYQEAKRMAEGGGVLFPSPPPQDGDARLIVHPPGYSLFIAAIGTTEPDRTYKRLRLIQIFCDSLSAAILLLIAAEFFPLPLAIIAALLAALSPHLCFYSLWLTPDSLAVLFISLAVLFIVRAITRPRLWPVVAAGVALGLSCWLRANGLLLAPLLACILLLFKTPLRWRHAAVLVAAAYVTISPITLRNWVVYGKFIPLSLGQGITMVEGIAEYDTEGRFDLPLTDREAPLKDAEWHNNPDYAANMWTPDGVERDRERFRRGLRVIRENPGWFLTTMADRSVEMLRLNDSYGHRRTWHIAQVPTIAPDPAFSHTAATSAGEPIATIEPADLIRNGQVMTRHAEPYVNDRGDAVLLADERHDFADQFASMPVPLREFTDYLLEVPAALEQGRMALKVTNEDRSVTISSRILTPVSESSSTGSMLALADEPKEFVTFLFSSGRFNQARIVLSNNGKSAARPVMRVGAAELYELGPTAQTWTRPIRAAARGIQKNLFKTGAMLPLVAIGICLLLFSGLYKPAAILFSLPLYYLSLQSALHTEYRYVLAISLFLPVFAAVALYAVATSLREGINWAWHKAKAAKSHNSNNSSRSGAARG